MYVLGIETSCDETSVSIVKNGKKVLSNIVTSSLKFHKKYGGVIPEIASRKQLEAIVPVAEVALKEAKLKLRDISLISVTSQPGLIGSLLVGICFARGLSLSLGLPIIEVDHLLAHLYASFLEKDKVVLPFVGLVISGGHTSLFYMEDFHKPLLIGKTCDDACGEAFDKVAKILNLGYPGGPIIEKLALKGDPKRIRFPLIKTKNPFDFSFSGIKTAVLYKTRSLLSSKMDKQLIYDFCASFQETVIKSLLKKALLACKIKNVKTLVLGGGVAINQCLRQKFKEETSKENIELFYPEKKFCLDNAAMVAGLGYYLYKKGTIKI